MLLRSVFGKIAGYSSLTRLATRQNYFSTTSYYLNNLKVDNDTKTGIAQTFN